jgi:hypothetical protein
MSDEDRKFFRLSLPLAKILPWAGALIVIVGGATFAITKYATENRVAALEREVAQKEKAIQQLKPSVSNIDATPYIPEATLQAGPNKQEAQQLVNKIQGLETEKRALISELSKYSQNTLDPKSELFPLVKQLESSSTAERLRALQGLFSLKDPRSIPYLVSYYKRSPDEATQDFNTNIYEWFNLLLHLDRPTGITFILDVLSSGDRYRTLVTVEYLKRLGDKADVAKIIPRLQEVALYSKDAQIRMQAKLLLQEYQLPSFKPKEPRSMYDILLDIEAAVKKLQKSK